MSRYSLALLVLFSSGIRLAAQDRNGPTRLALHPAGEPSPALRYQLLPDVPDQTPGNAALLYYRAFSPEWYNWRTQPKIYDKIYEALQTPLTKLSRKDWAWVVSSNPLHEVDLGARREYCEWELAARVRAEGINMLLPDMQSFREISSLLALRTRLYVADGAYTKAIYSLQTGMALSRNLADAPTLICVMVGAACANQQLAQIETLMQAPDSPNLYWALTGLPRPFFDLRKAYGGEKLFLFAEAPLLKDIEKSRYDSEQVKALATQMERLMSANDPRSSSLQRRGELLALTLQAYPAAKRALMAQGWKADDLEALPALQVVCIHALREALKLRDESFKWTGLPYFEAQGGIRHVEEEMNASRDVLALNPLVGMIQPAFHAFQAPWRVERRVAALRTIEAVRLYASVNEGKLPATLADIRMVPVPDDPLTGKAFGYQVDGDRFKLTGALPSSADAPYMAMIYEVTVSR